MTLKRGVLLLGYGLAVGMLSPVASQYFYAVLSSAGMPAFAASGFLGVFYGGTVLMVSGMVLLAADFASYILLDLFDLRRGDGSLA